MLFDHSHMIEFLRDERKFQRKSFWIDLTNGHLHFVDVYDHWKFIKDYFPQYNEFINNVETFISGEYNEFADSIPEDEHPEWHLYECWESSYKAEKMKELVEQLATDGIFRGTRHKHTVLIDNCKEQTNQFKIEKFFNEYDLKVDFV